MDLHASEDAARGIAGVVAKVELQELLEEDQLVVALRDPGGDVVRAEEVEVDPERGRQTPVEEVAPDADRRVDVVPEESIERIGAVVVAGADHQRGARLDEGRLPKLRAELVAQTRARSILREGAREEVGEDELGAVLDSDSTQPAQEVSMLHVPEEVDVPLEHVGLLQTRADQATLQTTTHAVTESAARAHPDGHVDLAGALVGRITDGCGEEVDRRERAERIDGVPRLLEAAVAEGVTRVDVRNGQDGGAAQVLLAGERDFADVARGSRLDVELDVRSVGFGIHLHVARDAGAGVGRVAQGATHLVLRTLVEGLVEGVADLQLESAPQ